MTDEPTTQPITDDDNQPATKAELKQLKTEMDTKFDAVLSLIKEEGKTTRDHFDAVTENIHQDVAGANKDEIDLLTNQMPDHEERLVDLEKNAGLPAGPRYEHVK